MEAEIHKKYDRQLRLWGCEGQIALSTSKIIMFGVHAGGTEALKNLVLPGVGHITLVSAEIVTNNHLETNFFLNHSDIGNYLSSSVLSLLLEMNEDVKGKSINSTVSEFFKNDENTNQFQGSSLVISDNLSKNENIFLSQLCHQHKIPFIMLKYVGMFCAIRIQAGIHAVYDSMPDNKFDLRLYEPWEDLLNLASQVDYYGPDFFQIPYVYLLLQAKKDINDYNTLSIAEQKKQVKEKIESWRNQCAQNHNKDIKKIENAQEALSNIHLLFQPFKWSQNLPSSLSELFLREECREANESSSDFWIVMKAVQIFYQKNKNIPLKNDLPDMHTSTDYYLELKKCYTRAAENDLKEMETLIHDITKGHKHISIAAIKYYLKGLRTSTIIPFKPYFESINDEYDVLDGEYNLWKWFLLMETIDDLDNLNIKIDLKNVKEHFEKSLQIHKIPKNIENHDIEEILRYENNKFATIASIIGGVASQEIIKILTHLFIPVNNVFIYDGIKSTSETYTF